MLGPYGAVVRLFVVVQRCSTCAGSLRGSGEVVCGCSEV